MGAKILNLAPKLNNAWLSHDIHLVSEMVFRKFEKELYNIASNAVTDGSVLFEVVIDDKQELEINILRPVDAIYE